MDGQLFVVCVGEYQYKQTRRWCETRNVYIKRNELMREEASLLLSLSLSLSLSLVFAMLVSTGARRRKETVVKRE